MVMESSGLCEAWWLTKDHQYCGEEEKPQGHEKQSKRKQGNN